MAFQTFSDGQILYAGSLNNNFGYVTIREETSNYYAGSQIVKTNDSHGVAHSGTWTAPMDCMVVGARAEFNGVAFGYQQNGWIRVDTDKNSSRTDWNSGTAIGYVTSGLVCEWSSPFYVHDRTDSIAPDDYQPYNIFCGLNGSGYTHSGQTITLYLECGGANPGSGFMTHPRFTVRYTPIKLISDLGSANWS